MNFFFGIKNNKFKSNITIPRFQNKFLPDNQYLLYRAYINNGFWIFENLDECKSDINFFYINEDYIENDFIFFLAKEKEVNKELKYEKLLNFNSFTNTLPAFRANFEVSVEGGGFSSYQSEYPFGMVNKKGSILSSLYSISNIEADENFLLFKNIYEKPLKEEFDIYFIDIKLKKIIKKETAKTNQSNLFFIEKELIKPEIYVFTDKYIGIPIYLSILENHLSLEHTNPIQEYILGPEKYEKVSNIKKEISESILKKNI